MRISLFALAGIAALSACLTVPAQADPKFLEPYGGIFSARPFLATPGDERPKDALQAQATAEESSSRRLLVSPFVWNNDDATTYGLGFGYASVHNPRHPWSLGFRYYNTDFDNAGSSDTVDADLKVALWAPADPRLPVVSLVGRYQDYDDLGERADALLAVDQRICRDLFATVNVGWADHINGSGSDFVGGVGATWRAAHMPRLSVSADYTLDNEVDGEDFWSISALYAFDRTSAVRVGGGKHGSVFANFVAKWDMK